MLFLVRELGWRWLAADLDTFCLLFQLLLTSPKRLRRGSRLLARLTWPCTALDVACWPSLFHSPVLTVL